VQRGLVGHFRGNREQMSRHRNKNKNKNKNKNDKRRKRLLGQSQSRFLLSIQKGKALLKNEALSIRNAAASFKAKMKMKEMKMEELKMKEMKMKTKGIIMNTNPPEKKIQMKKKEQNKNKNKNKNKKKNKNKNKKKNKNKNNNKMRAKCFLVVDESYLISGRLDNNNNVLRLPIPLPLPLPLSPSSSSPSPSSSLYLVLKKEKRKGGAEGKGKGKESESGHRETEAEAEAEAEAETYSSSLPSASSSSLALSKEVYALLGIPFHLIRHLHLHLNPNLGLLHNEKEKENENENENTQRTKLKLQNTLILEKLRETKELAGLPGLATLSFLNSEEIILEAVEKYLYLPDNAILLFTIEPSGYGDNGCFYPTANICLAGGGFNPGIDRDIYDVATRELHEETGIELSRELFISLYKHSWVIEDTSYYVLDLRNFFSKKKLEKKDNENSNGNVGMNGHSCIELVD